MVFSNKRSNFEKKRTNAVIDPISTDESVLCFEFTEESVNAPREHNF